jgi:hypothetical protein
MDDDRRTMACPYCGYTCTDTGIGAVYCGPHGTGAGTTPAVRMVERQYLDARTTVERLGMSIEDGLGFTVAGGLLTDGASAPRWIQEMNGWSVDEIADAATKRAEPLS